MKRILILTGKEVRLLKPFLIEAKKLSIDLTLAHLKDLEYDLSLGKKQEIKVGGTDLTKFDVIYIRVVRNCPEEVSIVADYARKNGIKIIDSMYSSSKITRFPIPKGLETKILIENGVPVPRTLFLTLEKIKSLAPKIFGFPFVVKATRGMWGTEVWLAENEKALQILIEKITRKEKLGRRFLAQEFIKSPLRIRVFVVGGKSMAGIARKTRWLNRFSDKEPIKKSWMKVPKKYAIMAEHAAKSVQVDVAGVDILESENGNLYVLEVNSAPIWKSTKRDTGLNVEAEILRFLST